MSRAAYPLKLPASVKRAAQQLAKEDGVSLNQWIAVAVAQKIGAVQTAAEFFAKRSAGASGDLASVLDRVPNLPPEPGDELPEGWKPTFKRHSGRSVSKPDNGRRGKYN